MASKRRFPRMVRSSWLISLPLGIAFLLFLTTMASIAAQAQSNDDVNSAGQEYVVQSGDSLSSIAERFYGDGNAWRRIVEATNALAEADPRYSVITTPSFIRTGQRLWLPDVIESLPANAIATPPPPTATLLPTPTQLESTPTLVATPAATIAATIASSLTTAVPTTTAISTATTIAPRVFFVSPSSEATISQTTIITMAALGVTVEPAGAIRADAGHMHILVDTDFVPAGELIINDDQHLHYGQGQLTASLNLTPGEHVLRLQFANGAHIALAGDEYRDEISVTVAAEEEDSPAVRFVNPIDGSVVSPTLSVEMTAVGLDVEPAGEIREGAGHMHVLVDTDFVPAGELIINDGQHLHYGQGQLTTTLNLTPGEHTLRLQFANGAHIALDGDEYRDEISVTVPVDAEEPSTAVRFVSPVDGETVESPFSIEMAAVGLDVEPAGEIRENAGHLHILVDTDFVPAGELIINDGQHLHYGQGELTTIVELEPGEHVLRLQFANGAHIAQDGDEYQDEITVVVEK